MDNTIDLTGIEIPRHVHRLGGVGQGGESRIVSTESELRSALADGWVIDPNAEPNEPPAEAPDVPGIPDEDESVPELADADVPDEDEPVEDVPAPHVKRGRGGKKK